MATRYYISLPDGARARGANTALSFTAQSGPAFAAELEDALRTPAWFERWRATQADPDAVDPAWGVVDANATVQGAQDDLHIDLVVTTSIPGNVLKQRLRAMAGGGWELRDVTAA